MDFFLDEDNFDPIKGKCYYYEVFLCPQCATTKWRDFHDILFDENRPKWKIPPPGMFSCQLCGNRNIYISRGTIIGLGLQDEIQKAFNELKQISDNNQEFSDKYEVWLSKWKYLREERLKEEIP